MYEVYLVSLFSEQIVRPVHSDHGEVSCELPVRVLATTTADSQETCLVSCPKFVLQSWNTIYGFTISLAWLIT